MYSDQGANISYNRETHSSTLPEAKLLEGPRGAVTHPSELDAPHSVAVTDAVRLDLHSENSDLQSGGAYRQLGRKEKGSVSADDLRGKLPDLLIPVPDAAADLQAQLRIESPSAIELSSPSEILARIETRREGDEVAREFRRAVLEAYRS